MLRFNHLIILFIFYYPETGKGINMVFLLYLVSKFPIVYVCFWLFNTQEIVSAYLKGRKTTAKK